ncbi:MAG: prolipoprotein diacylglyceryl transferase [Blastochloris sp.]|nr:prolipoprotein diacylglyceryl transferase [Blastochloris sp.]
MAYILHDFSPFLWQWSEQWGIRYYGLAYVLGFLATWQGLRIFRRRGWSHLEIGQESDLLTWLVLGVLIGGRLGYVLFYESWELTLQDPLSIIAFWREGGISGMASHGGFIGVILALVLFSYVHKISFWPLADNIAVFTPLGLGLGRIANFINGELWGRPTDLPWAFLFPQDPTGLPRHPSQLYEAFLEGFLIFAIMLILRKRMQRPGRIGLIFLCLYAVARIFCEFFREPDPQIGYIFGIFTQGQLLSFGLILIALILWPFLPQSTLSKTKLR